MVSFASSLSERSSICRLEHVAIVLERPGTSSEPTSFCATLIAVTWSLSSVTYHSAIRPLGVSGCCRKSHEGRCLARSAPRWPAAMRHVLFM